MIDQKLPLSSIPVQQTPVSPTPVVTVPAPLTPAVPQPSLLEPPPIAQTTTPIPTQQEAPSSIPSDQVQTPVIEQHPVQIHPEEYQKQKMKTKVLKILSGIITIGLTLEGLKGLYESLYFVLVEFQHFEEALVDHQIDGSLINQLALKAGLLVFSTAISLFFAIQLAFHHTKLLKVLHIAAGIIVLIVTYSVMRYANSIDILGLGVSP